MRLLRRVQQLEALRRQPCLLGARVIRVGSTLDEPALLERVEDSRYATEAEPGRVGERGQAQHPFVRRGQAREQLEAADAEAVLGLQLRLELAGQALVRLEETDPRGGVHIRQLHETIATDRALSASVA